MIKVSSGTLGVLGLTDVRVDAPPTTAYLMVGGRCRRDCGFCAQARSSQAPATALSRVSWPEWDETEVLDAVRRAHASGEIQRCCLQVTVSSGSVEQSRSLVARLGGEVPISVSAVASVEQVGELLASGAERVGLSLDAVNEELYRRVKGGDLNRALAGIEEAAGRFPGRITTHLMVGLGETEEEMVCMIALLLSRGVVPALFAFTPIRGTALEAGRPPSLARYRRLQAARQLLVQRICGPENISFSRQGRIESFGMADRELEEALADGKAFQTSGCPGCNRPYYNEAPRGPMYNYPRGLSPEEIRRAVEEAMS